MPDSQASREAGLKLSDAKLRRVRPGLYGWRGVLDRFLDGGLTGNRKTIAQHLLRGDADAAVVLEVTPRLLVSAYGEDLDAAVVLVFPDDAVDTAGWSSGRRLVAVNSYNAKGPAEADLEPGPGGSGRWVDFTPLIGDFLSDDTERLARLKELIPPQHWDRAAELGARYRRRHPTQARDGRPGFGGLRSL